MKPIKNEVNKLFEPESLIAAYSTDGNPMFDYICIRVVRREPCAHTTCSQRRTSCFGLGEHMIAEALDPRTKQVIRKYKGLCLGWNEANFEWRKYEERGESIMKEEGE